MAVDGGQELGIPPASGKVSMLTRFKSLFRKKKTPLANDVSEAAVTPQITKETPEEQAALRAEYNNVRKPGEMIADVLAKITEKNPNSKLRYPHGTSKEILAKIFGRYPEDQPISSDTVRQAQVVAWQVADDFSQQLSDPDIRADVHDDPELSLRVAHAFKEELTYLTEHKEDVINSALLLAKSGNVPSQEKDLRMRMTESMSTMRFVTDTLEAVAKEDLEQERLNLEKEKEGKVVDIRRKLTQEAASDSNQQAQDVAGS